MKILNARYKLANIGVTLASKEKSQINVNLKGWGEFYDYETDVSLRQITRGFDTIYSTKRVIFSTQIFWGLGKI